MKELYRFLAFDLGAESGRAVCGVLAKDHIELEVLHRFRTEGLTMLGTRQWDLPRIYEEICTGLTCYARKYGPQLDGIGVDTWGVDFGLLTKDGELLANPVHYRDKRTDGMMEHAFSILPKDDIYRATGIQFLPFNTLYQLLSMRQAQSPILEVADGLLMMGDLLSYLLCGNQACEYTAASTSQLLEPHTRTWNKELLDTFDLPKNLLRDIVPPGTIIGKLLPDIAERTGLSPDTPIIAPCIHDTGSAVAATPVSTDSGPWAYLSSGTWSLLGAELPEPMVNEESLKEDFTNEGGAENTIRFLKNIFGLWLVQECRRVWERETGESLDYSTLTAEAEAAPAFTALIDLDDPRLLAPDNMPELIQTLCRESGQPVPETRGEIIRCALESLAMKYRQTLHTLDRLLGRKTERLYIIGGGTQNKLLCQMTADACGIPVTAGPVEATALGNIGLQAIGVGALDSVQALRTLIAHSSPLEQYQPKNTTDWDQHSAK